MNCQVASDAKLPTVVRRTHVEFSVPVFCLSQNWCYHEFVAFAFIDDVTGIARDISAVNGRRGDGCAGGNERLCASVNELGQPGRRLSRRSAHRVVGWCWRQRGSVDSRCFRARRICHFRDASDVTNLADVATELRRSNILSSRCNVFRDVGAQSATINIRRIITYVCSTIIQRFLYSETYIRFEVIYKNPSNFLYAKKFLEFHSATLSTLCPNKKRDNVVDDKLK